MKPLLRALCVALLAFAVYVPSLGGDFVYDDLYQIRENDQLRSLANVPRFFRADVWAAVGLPFSSYYRPLMYTTFAIETAIAGPEPRIFRTTNALLHAAASVLLLLLLRRLGASEAAAFIAGLLFAVHPMHPEVVAWPSARPELLVTLFTLLAAWVFARSDPRAGPTPARFVAVGGLTMLALLSKETGILAPVLIGLVALQRAPGRPLERVGAGVRAAFPFLALVVVFIGLRSLAIRISGTPPLVGDDPLLFPFRSWPEATVRITAIAGRYLGVMLLPLDASSFRVPSWENVGWGLALVPLGLAAIALAPWRRSAGWLAFAFLAIAVQSIGVPSAGYLSQRYAYLPSLGVCAALGLVLARLLFDAAVPPLRRAAGTLLVAGLVAACVLLLLPRAAEWANEPRLWAAAIVRDPDSPAALVNQGYMLLDQGRATEALVLFRRVEEVEPGGWASPYGEANALTAMGRLQEAIPFYQRAISRAPKIPYLHQSLGFAYEDLGDFASARRTYDAALKLFPDSALGQGVVSVLEARQGNPAQALAKTESALALRPDQPTLRMNRVALLAEMGRVDEAIAAADALLDDERLAPEAQRRLGILYDRYHPDAARAVHHYREALRLAPDRPDAGQLRRRIATLERSLGGP